MRKFIFLLPVLILGCTALGIKTEHVGGKVLNTYTKRIDNHDTYFIIVLLDNGPIETFKDTDATFQGKFNSADIYAQAVIAQQTQQHVDLEITGFRSGFLSEFRNIVKVKR
jgi:hypothetical protein